MASAKCGMLSSFRLILDEKRLSGSFSDCENVTPAMFVRHF